MQVRASAFFWGLGGLTALLAVAAVAYRAWPLLFPNVAEVAPLDRDCDLRAGPCASPLPGGGWVTLSVQPSTIPVMRPLHLEVVVEGAEASDVELDFRGVDMNMGLNRARLHGESDGVFEGEGMLPVCASGRMLWEARVLLQTERGLVAAPFRFWTTRPGS